MSDELQKLRQGVASNLCSNQVAKYRKAYVDSQFPESSVTNQSIECLANAVAQLRFGEIDKINPLVLDEAVQSINAMKKSELQIENGFTNDELSKLKNLNEPWETDDSESLRTNITNAKAEVLVSDFNKESKGSRQEFGLEALTLNQASRTLSKLKENVQFYDSSEILRLRLQLEKGLSRHIIPNDLRRICNDYEKNSLRIWDMQTINDVEEAVNQRLKSLDTIKKVITAAESFVNAVNQSDVPIVDGNSREKSMTINNSSSSYSSAQAISHSVSNATNIDNSTMDSYDIYIP